MVRISIAVLISFAAATIAVGDPAGVANVGNKQGKQFITGGCTSDADCASGCCAGLQDGAVCSAKLASTQNGKQGCGFGGAGAGGAGNQNNNQNNGQNAGNGNAGAGAGNANNNGGKSSVGDPAGVANVGNKQGKQFITGGCTSDADCASGCCAGLQDGAVCSAKAASTQNGKQGCGFGGAGAGAGAGGAQGGAQDGAGADAGAGAGACDGAQGDDENDGQNDNQNAGNANAGAGNANNGAKSSVGDPAGAANVGNKQGKQFITGGCTSDADCASGCCAGLRDGAVCSGKDVSFDNGKQGCGFGGGAGAGKKMARAWRS